MAMGYDADVLHKTNDITHTDVSQELDARNYTMRDQEPLMDADEIIRRMRQVYNVKRDTELAQELGLSKAAPSNWRQRNSPPYEVCVEIAREKGISLDWLIFGVGDMRLGVREVMANKLSDQHPARESSPRAESISQFVYWWHVNRTQDEMVWLEQQFKRAVPEYAEWLATSTLLPTH
jgi:transcriptional regulator with XRE-family HTH domain